MTHDDLNKAIKDFYPEGTAAEHNIMKLSLCLQGIGNRLSDVLPTNGSHFVILASRDDEQGAQ